MSHRGRSAAGIAWAAAGLLFRACIVAAAPPGQSRSLGLSDVLRALEDARDRALRVAREQPDLNLYLEELARSLGNQAERLSAIGAIEPTGPAAQRRLATSERRGGAAAPTETLSTTSSSESPTMTTTGTTFALALVSRTAGGISDADAGASSPTTAISTGAGTSTGTPEACDIVDGSAFSRVYPCTCGEAVCHDSEVCHLVFSECSAAGSLLVTVPCTNSFGWTSWGSAFFYHWHTSVSGAPIYHSSQWERYIYHDPDCNGAGSYPRWIVGSSVPNPNAEADLDGDGVCNYRRRLRRTTVAPCPLETLAS